MVIDTLNVDFFCVQELITKSISTVEYFPMMKPEKKHAAFAGVHKCREAEGSLQGSR